MGRVGLGLLAALVAADAAYAQSAAPDNNAKSAQAAANAHCAALGEGFFAVSGSTTCLRISGHVSAGVGFATATSGPHPPGGTTLTGSSTEEGVSADARFDTPMGPGRVYVHMRSAQGPHWMTDGQ